MLGEREVIAGRVDGFGDVAAQCFDSFDVAELPRGGAGAVVVLGVAQHEHGCDRFAQGRRTLGERFEPRGQLRLVNGHHGSFVLERARKRVGQVMRSLRVPTCVEHLLADGSEHVVERKRVGERGGGAGENHEQVTIGRNWSTASDSAAESRRLQRDDRNAGRHARGADNLEFAIVGGVEFHCGCSRSATLRPTDNAELGASAHGKFARGVHNRDAVDRIRAVHRVLMHAGSADALVIGGNNDPTFVDRLLQSGNAVINLCGAAGCEIQGELTGRVGLGRWARCIADTGGAMGPRHHSTVVAWGVGRNDESGRFGGHAVHVVRRVTNSVRNGALDRRRNLFVMQQDLRHESFSRMGGRNGAAGTLEPLTSGLCSVLGGTRTPTF